MTRFLGKYTDVFYAFLRIVAGYMFMLHGAQKHLGVLGGQTPPALLPQIAGWIELICGFLILIGLFASVAAFIASGTMAVAYFMAHAANAQYVFPVLEGELAVLYCFVFLFIAARGAGPLSVASALGKPELG